MAFAIAQEGQPEAVNIYTLEIESGELDRLTTAGLSSSPTWSPDGKFIAHSSGDDIYKTSLFIIRSDGSCNFEVPGVNHVMSPDWSPDGKTIAFLGEARGIYQLELEKLQWDDFLTNEAACP